MAKTIEQLIVEASGLSTGTIEDHLLALEGPVSAIAPLEIQQKATAVVESSDVTIQNSKVVSVTSKKADITGSKQIEVHCV